jgi:hypothetical protein
VNGVNLGRIRLLCVEVTHTLEFANGVEALEPMETVVFIGFLCQSFFIERRVFHFLRG